MKDLFRYLIIRLTTRHATTAINIFERIYLTDNNEPVVVINNTKIVGNPNKPNPVTFSTTTTLPKSSNVVKKDQKKELEDSLSYLKGKEIKSKQDKSSISMIEGILASM